MKTRIRSSACLVAILVLSSLALAQKVNKYEVAGIDDAAAVEKFFHNLQEAMARGDRVRIASMVSYPITVMIAGRKVRLRNRAEFLRRYNVAINLRVKHAVAGQNVENLFVNYQGVMIGDGEIWFNQPSRSKLIKIIAINN